MFFSKLRIKPEMQIPETVGWEDDATGIGSKGGCCSVRTNFTLLVFAKVGAEREQRAP
jgi:hypothetical protein